MKVTIKDVAKEANVATSTVSRVLSNSPRISEQTKERVNDAIRKLNYKPNMIDRSLASNKTRILGVVLPQEADDILNNPFFITAMKGLSKYAQRKNYYITYAFSENEENEIEHIKEITRTNLVDGVVLLRVSENDKNIEYLKNIEFPFVVIGRPQDEENTLWVDNDNFNAMYNVVNKLIQNGHKKIGFIGALKNLKMSIDRFEGYKKALEDNCIDYDESLVFHGSSFEEKIGQEASTMLLENTDVTAIVTTDDLLAFGVLSEIDPKGINNIAVVGFNNTQLSMYQNPPLATVDINADKLGYQAAKLLIKNLEENRKKTHYIVETEFVERESFL